MSYTSTLIKPEPPPHGCEPYHSLCCLARQTRIIEEHFFGNSPTKAYVSTIKNEAEIEMFIVTITQVTRDIHYNDMELSSASSHHLNVILNEQDHPLTFY